MERIFLGWDRPVLPQAVDWFEQRFARPDVWDLSRVIIVVPAGRAGRRLVELLVDRAGVRLLLPPTIVGPGDLPEMLYTPTCPVLDDLPALLLRAAVLREADPAVMRAFTRRAPSPDDHAGWVNLAMELAAVRDELAAELLTPADVASNVIESAERWQAIAAFEAAYEQAMAQRGVCDQTLARRTAIQGAACRTDRHVILLAAADLSGLVRSMLSQLQEQLTSLVAAPLSEASAFGELGELNHEAWSQRALDLDDQRIVMVDQPRDQARTVVQQLAAAAQTDGPEDVVVGLGDEALAPAVQRTLQLSGAPVRLAAGSPAARSRPVALLEAVERFLRSRRFDDFAALLRHPDVPVRSVHRTQSWLALLDRYAQDHVQGRVTGHWLGEQAEALGEVWSQVHAILPEQPDVPRPLSAWATPIANLLQHAYGHLTLRRQSDEESALLQALEAIAKELATFAALSDQDPTTPHVTASAAIALLRQRLSERSIHPPAGEPAVELLGFLELPLDDSPVAVVVGVNQGSIPQTITSHPLLPDGLRRRLGLPDNQRRYARDLYAMTVITRTRPGATLITGRRTADGDPLAPSRLLLACTPEKLVERIHRFYREKPASSAAPLVAPGVIDGPSRIGIIRPQPQTQPIDRLPVTAFRDYLACPYRFYLKHVLKLKTLSDDAVELSGSLFGTLAHDILSIFGHSEAAHCSAPQDIAQYLYHELDRNVARRFGEDPPAIVVLQAEQLRERLEAFAHEQAAWVRDGWRIVVDQVERRHQATLVVDGKPFTITGTIDRIDVHPKRGYRVVDYKTADAGEGPEKAHRERKDKWTDLQLPLYRELVRGTNVRGPLDLGYILLPRDLSKVGFVPCGWTEAEVDEAVEMARDVIRAVRAGAFWEPAEAPRYDDFSNLCYGGVADRSPLLQEYAP